MNQIEWCKKQKKGIRLIEPDNNIAEDYFKKSEDSLKVMQSINIDEWKVVSAYYSCYYSLYALLQKAGIKCEIHECSIVLMEFIGFNKEDIKFIQELKTKRINAQYYTQKVSLVDEKKIKDFILKCKEINHNANFKEIKNSILKK